MSQDHPLVQDFLNYLRFERHFKPYSVHLIDARQDNYPGTHTPKNSSSDVRIIEEERNVISTLEVRDLTLPDPDRRARREHSFTEGRTGDVVWFPVDRAAAGLMDRATRDLQPFAAPSAWPTRYADRLFTPTTRTTAGAPTSR